MTDEQYLQLARRLGGLEQSTLRPRMAVVDDVDPLTVRVAGGPTPVVAQQVDGARLEVGMNVFVVTWTGGLVVLGPIGSPIGRWLRVGDSGVPAFSPGIAHRQGDTGDGFEWVCFRKTADGTVELKGVLNVILSTSPNATILILPPGYRPTMRRLLYAQASNGINRVDVTPSGDVIVGPNLNNGMWLSLEGLRFDAA